MDVDDYGIQGQDRGNEEEDEVLDIHPDAAEYAVPPCTRRSSTQESTERRSGMNGVGRGLFGREEADVLFVKRGDRFTDTQVVFACALKALWKDPLPNLEEGPARQDMHASAALRVVLRVAAGGSVTDDPIACGLLLSDRSAPPSSSMFVDFCQSVGNLSRGRSVLTSFGVSEIPQSFIAVLTMILVANFPFMDHDGLTQHLAEFKSRAPSGLEGHPMSEEVPAPSGRNHESITAGYGVVDFDSVRKTLRMNLEECTRFEQENQRLMKEIWSSMLSACAAPILKPETADKSFGYSLLLDNLHLFLKLCGSLYRSELLEDRLRLYYEEILRLIVLGLIGPSPETLMMVTAARSWSLMLSYRTATPRNPTSAFLGSVISLSMSIAMGCFLSILQLRVKAPKRGKAEAGFDDLRRWHWEHRGLTADHCARRDCKVVLTDLLTSMGDMDDPNRRRYSTWAAYPRSGGLVM